MCATELRGMLTACASTAPALGVRRRTSYQHLSCAHTPRHTCCFLLLRCQLSLFYITGMTRHSRPEFLYFWFYFVVVNGVWIVVPLACIIYACRHINAAVSW